MLAVSKKDKECVFMNIKKLVAVVTVVGLLGAGGAVYASTNGEVLNGVGRGVCNTFAKDSAEFEQFKANRLEEKKTILDQRVKDGAMTQEQADEIFNALKENQANCDGTGSNQIGKKYGAGFGQGMGNGQGRGMGMGRGCQTK